MKGGSPANLLLDWYDTAARSLPWRVGPHETAAGLRQEPYIVWLSEIMLQQTTVATVGPYFRRFLDRWPTVEALAAAPQDDVLAAWAGLGYYARARNLIRCARTVAESHQGQFPDTEDGLLTLPGVGPYTAAAIAAIAFDRSSVVVDGNVERVIARYRRIETPLPAAKPEIKAAAAELTPIDRPGDYAQAIMDLGATICTPKRPACALCPWMAACAARREGVAERLPAKTRKAPKPTRRGRAFILVDGVGRVMLERRPESGLLGGMMGLPTTEWRDETLPMVAPDDHRPTPAAPWRALGAEARHTFTHFHLVLDLDGAVLSIDQHGLIEDGDAIWAHPEEFGSLALPTLMQKALEIGLKALEND